MTAPGTRSCGAEPVRRAAAGTPDGFRRAEGLGVDQTGGRDGLAAFGDANMFTQGVMDPGQGAVGGPDGEAVSPVLVPKAFPHVTTPRLRTSNRYFPSSNE
jgi:hypothetical protein